MSDGNTNETGASAADGSQEPFLGEVSPNGDLQAVVQDDGRTVYLYLAGPEESGFGVRAVWVRNRVAAPAEWVADPSAPPLVPAANTRFPQGQPAIDREKAVLVWLPEGSGVALCEDGQMIAAIVPWSGVQGFPGYARDAVGACPAAVEFPETGEIHERFSAAEAFWTLWENEGNPWPKLQEQLVTSYRAVLGTPQQVYAIDNQTWPPKALLRIPGDAGIALVTVGISLRPQPIVDPAVPDPRLIRRVEFGVMLPKNASDQDLQRYGSLVVGLADLPWSKYAWLEEGTALPTDGLDGTPYSALLLASSRNYGPKVELPEWDGDPVTLLWLVPVSKQELESVQKSGGIDKIEYPRSPRLIIF